MEIKHIYPNPKNYWEFSFDTVKYYKYREILKAEAKYCFSIERRDEIRGEIYKMVNSKLGKLIWK